MKLRLNRTIHSNAHDAPVPLIVIGSDPAVADYARHLFAVGTPFGVVSDSYSDIVPFMLGNNGHTVALVADIDDSAQLAEAIVLIEKRIGRVHNVVRYSTDLPHGTHTAA
ncbi:hypothetical protein GOEFS_115_01080 [Gordonia effusa NBRC 100432]|uniref:Uncharacterized protein n=1 Tax=Gordonia effusa NBRC 100432 TaxID=1077974 RepID=H0R5W7_9ACTN|nr:hypothetical protein [Gordonia effusa]GAB20468.1 hypothetical protein GOEFS_115_01080 [Gordonia effusa NBRC 100432]